MQGTTTYYYTRCFYVCNGDIRRAQERAAASFTLVRSPPLPAASKPAPAVLIDARAVRRAWLEDLGRGNQLPRHLQSTIPPACKPAVHACLLQPLIPLLLLIPGCLCFHAALLLSARHAHTMQAVALGADCRMRPS